MAKSSTSKSSTTTSKNTSGTVVNGTYQLSASQQAAANAQKAINASAAKGTTVANDTGSKTNGSVTTYSGNASKSSGTSSGSKSYTNTTVANSTNLGGNKVSNTSGYVSNGTYVLSPSQQAAANAQKALNANAPTTSTVYQDKGSATNGTVYTYNPTTSGYNNTGYGTSATVTNSYNTPLTSDQLYARAAQEYINANNYDKTVSAQDAKSKAQYDSNKADRIASTLSEYPSSTQGTIITHNSDGSTTVLPNGDETLAYTITAAQKDAANSDYVAEKDNYGVTTNPYSYLQMLQNANQNYDSEGNYIGDTEVKDAVIDKNYNLEYLLNTDLSTELLSGSAEAVSTYTDIYNTISEILNNYGDEISSELKQALQDQLDKINAQYDLAARNYYIQYRNQMATMPELLSSLGVTGGATETAALKALNSYGSNLASNENSRYETLADVDTSYRQKIAENNQDVANQLANYYYQIKMQQIQDAREDAQLAYERQQEANKLAYQYAALAANSY